MMAGKLGLNAFDPATDEELCSEPSVLSELIETDMSYFLPPIGYDRHQHRDAM